METKENSAAKVPAPEGYVDRPVGHILPMPEGLRNILRHELEKARLPLPDDDRKYPMRVMLHAENLNRWEEYNAWADSLPNTTMSGPMPPK